MRTTAWLVGLILHLAAAIATSFVPLFDVLGFERAFVTGLLCAPVTAAIGVALVARARTEGGDDLGRLFAVAVGLGGLLLVPTIVAGGLVELIRQPCDPGEGLLFIVLIGGGGVVFGAAIGVTAATVGSRRTLAAGLIALVLIADLATSLHRLYAEPQIFVYSYAFGFWPGSLYDENLPITVALWGQRGLVVLIALAVVAWARAFTDPASLLIFRGRTRWMGLLAAVVLTTAAVGVDREGETLGFDLDRGSVERALSRHVDRARYRIRVDPAMSNVQLARLEADVTLRIAQLDRFFGQAPADPITVFLYRTVDQKKRLMGAGRTQIARPWANEIHIHRFTFPHPTLKHELAHVFAAMFASGPFLVPAAGTVMVNVGIVEGIAVAADWPARQMTVHEWTRAMRHLGLAPDPRQTLYPAGFWAISSGRAYTSAGSFIRHLIDRHGIERFAELYRTNEFERAYDEPLDSLVAEWERFIDDLPLRPENLAIAEHRFRRPGIFEKVCAHTTAALARSGYAKLAAGDLEAAAAELEQVVENRPGSVDDLLALAEGFAKAGDLERARGYVERARNREGITAESVTRSDSAAADLAWRSGDRGAARRGYESVEARQSVASARRLTLAKRMALDRDDASQGVLQRYLTGRLPRAQALVEIGELARAPGGDGLVPYLYARLLEGAGAYDRGIDSINSAMARGLPGPQFELEANKTLGRLLILSGHGAAAAAHYRQMAVDARVPVERLLAEDWAELGDVVGTGTSSAGIEVDSTKFER